MTSRERWKAYYRLLRIARREAIKASIDLAVYGTCFIMYYENGEAEYIPLNQVQIHEAS